MKTEQIPVISAEYLLELEAKADKLREEILSTPNMEIPADSTVYYISPNGNDNDDGRSPATAWKTITRLKAAKLAYGNYVCFERGGMWRGRIMAQPGVTYTAYGEGPKPEFRGSAYDGAVDGWWDEVAPHIWRYSIKFSGDVGMIVMNHGEENGIKMVMSYDNEGTKELVSGRVWNGFISLEKNCEFFHDLGDRWMKNTASDGAYVYLYCDKGNPAKVWNSIEFIDLGAIFRIDNFYYDVTLDNLCLKYSNFGVSCGSEDNIRIQNCEIGWMGGCVHGYSPEGAGKRFGNGVELYGSCKNFVCDHNWVYQCYDAGLTHQYQRGRVRDIIMDGAHYTNNLVEKCVYNIEYFLGVTIPGATATRYMTDVLIKNNILMDAGGFGMQRFDHAQAAHIKGWDHFNRLQGDFIIEDNILLRSERMMIHTGCERAGDEPLYRNNIFVQYADGQWGRNGVNPTKLQMYTPDVANAEEYAGNEFFIVE